MARVKVRGKKSGSSGRSLGRVEEASKRSKGREWLTFDDGDKVVARVLNEYFLDAYVHRVPIEGENGRYHMDVACLDQEDKGVQCPGCKDDLQRRYKFWTPVIVRDVEDDKGNVSDKMMIWSGGITVAKRLNKMHAKHGLDNRDVEIEREGSTKDDTSYNIDWAEDENSELSADDLKLVKNRPDIKRYATPPDKKDFYKSPKERGDESDEQIGKKALKRDAFGAKKRKTAGGSTGTRRSVGKGSNNTKSKVTVRRRKS